MAAPVVRGNAGGLTFELVRRPVHPGLRGLVAGFSEYVEQSAAPVRRRQAPTAKVPLILSRGPSIAVDGARHSSFVAGLYEYAVHTEYTGAQSGLELMLTPLGAFRLLGVPPGELANRTVSLPLVEALADRVESLTAVEDLLLRRAREAPLPDPAVAWAWAMLARSGGRVPVGRLAAEIGWSRRHFAARFRAQVGLAPKAAARVLRFERSSALLARGASASTVAATCGYADQSHLSREFQALAGCTPTRFLSERDQMQVTFVQDR